MSNAARRREVVMAGLDPAIHAFVGRAKKDVDARVKPGHDELGYARS